MSERPQQSRHSARDLETILGVTSALAAPFDLMTMLAEVVSAAKQVLKADRGSVWLYDAAADELVLEVATGIAPGARAGRRGSGRGVCAQPPDHQRARLLCGLAVRPRRRQGVRISHALHAHPAAGRPQGRPGGGDAGAEQGAAAFSTTDDEALATALAAQCAVALQRVRMTEAVIEGEKMRQELEMARVVQMSTLPASMPARARLRCLRHVPAGRAHRRRYVRSCRARPGSAGRSGRCYRPRHCPGAFGDADAGDAAHGVSSRRRPRDRVHAGQQPAGRYARRRPLHHGVHRPARRRRPSAAFPQRRAGADPAFPGGDRHLRAPQSDQFSARRHALVVLCGRR